MADQPLSPHEQRILKRIEKREERQQEQQHGQKAKERRGKLYLGIMLLIVVGLAYGVSSLSSTGNGIKPQYDLSGIPDSFVHWHADVDILICGEEQTLPEAAGDRTLGGLMGTSGLHTHGKAENLRSMPTSDGNGVIHNEAVIPRQPQEQTLGRFLDLMNIPFSETQVLQSKNGDSCAGSPGTVKLFVNGQENSQWRDYIPRDGDVIRIEFS